MLAKAVRNKCKRLFAMFLVLTFLVQGITPVFASDNGTAYHTKDEGKDTPAFVTSLNQNLAVMLYDGKYQEFVMDSRELTASVEEGYLPHVTKDYASELNEGFLGMSVTKAYAQVFRRTQVAWNSPGAGESLLLMGPDVTWGVGGTGPGTVTMSADQKVIRGTDFFRAHKVQGNSSYGGLVTQIKFANLEKGWSGAPNGTGVFKAKIVDYLTKYFNGDTSVGDPDVFFRGLVQNASNAEKTLSNGVWQYIAAGPNAVRKGDPMQGPSYRWNKVFEKSGQKLDSDATFIGGGYMYVLEGGQEKKLDANKPDEYSLILDQIASYYDTLISLSVLADIGVTTASSGKNISKLYLDAAIDSFGKPGIFVTKLDQLEQKKSIIFDTWTSHAYNSPGNAMGGSAVTHTDNWGAYRKAYVPWATLPSGDWRSQNTFYNDYHEFPLADDGYVAKNIWKGKGGSVAPETMDRIALRLSLIPADKRPAITDSKLDITTDTIWLPGAVGYGPTSALLGRSAGQQPNTIATGLTGKHPNYRGLDNTQLDMVGGQFAVYMYGQKMSPITVPGFTHSISATPDDQTVTPRAELNQNIKVTYKLGNDFTDKGEATVDLRLLDDFVATFIGMSTAPETQSELQARTSLTRQVTKYKLDTLWMPGAGKPERVGGITPDTAIYDVPAVTTALGTETIPASTFNSDLNGGWTTININDLKNLMTLKNSVMFTLNDDSYRSTLWQPNPLPEAIDRVTSVAGGRIYEVFTPGSDQILEVMYTANTEIRIAHNDGTYHVVNYGGNASDPSVAKYPKKDEVPALLSKTYAGTHNAGKFEPAKDPASFVYAKAPEYEVIPLPEFPFVKSSLPYGVYSSSPEAYAELKNWGVASFNEPGDNTGLGDGRSPVDTQLGVSGSRASNGSDRINEDYEAMAGVPTTEKLYLAVGGSEFIIDIAVQYVPNETAVRTYHSYFAGVKNQFNYESSSGAGGDAPENSLFTGYPTAGLGSVSGTVTHAGGTITYTHSGSIDATAAIELSGDLGSGSGDPWSGTIEAAEPSHPEPGSDSKTATIKATVTPDAGDVAEFNATMDDLEAWVEAMIPWITSLEHTSGSDKVSRPMSKGEVGEFTFIRNENPGTQGASGSFSTIPPSELWYIEDDGTETAFNLVTFAGGSYSVTNPSDQTASSTKTHDSTEILDEEGNVTGYDHSDGGGPETYSQSVPTWNVSASFTIRPHVMCGPDCGHTLPEINDIWQQSFNYDYLKIIGLSVLRLDQGSADDETGRGLNALIGTKKLGVTRQTYYSSPTMSLAQANIFNYMGLQTDGTKDVYNATNEYFRSIAYGVGTTYGNTKSSEANRVQYYMTDADGKVLSVKGTKNSDFPRYENKGNQEVKTSFANEVKTSSWKSLTDGIVDAGDYVRYDFGPRSNLSDGTSRGYQYNMDKSSWVEQKDGVYRGKAAYDLPWAKGFIYDGVRKTGAIDASGYSVSRSLRNSSKGGEMAGIYQNGTKGWQGTGMTTTTLNYKTISYEAPFSAEYFIGQNAEMKKAYNEGDVSKFSTTATPTWQLGVLYQPAVRDWGQANHALYSDTRNLLEPGGASMPGATADWAPRDAMAKMWTENKVDRADDRYAQTQPFATDNMLEAFSNTANDGGARIKATSEYKLMQAKRDELVYATVISDALVLDLPNGYQPIVYHYKNAIKPVAAEDRIPDTRISFEELWLNNLFTPNSWSDTPKGTSKDGVIIGGYNGDLSNSRTTATDVQHRLRWRADAIPATPNMFIQDKTVSIEEPTGIIGKAFGALKVNGYNINRHLGHNGDIPTRILSKPVANKAAVGNPVQRTLLYNVAPIVLSADNREYRPGIAEAFWETIVQWKDDSNHDYYGKFVTGNGRGAIVPDIYMPDGTFVRLPALLGNYGQKERSETLHTFEKGADLMKDYFKYTPAAGGEPLEAYGASEARAAQAEQYSRGFAVTGYNYDSTNREKLDGKTFKNMYNESPDLTGSAKGTPYVAQDATHGIKVGVPFIVEVVKDDKVVTGYKASSATRRVGPTGAAAIPKAGYIQRAAYTTQEDQYGKYELNNIVVHNIVSARATQIMPIAEWRDQRVIGQSLVGAERDANRFGAPGTLEYAVLDCKYDKPLKLLELNFIGSGKSVPNQAKDQVTTGNIILAGNYAMSSTGLTSGGSARTGVSLADLGGEYYKALDYQVTSEITYNANTGEQMLFGFQGYGITLNTATKKLYIRKSGSTGYMEVAGVFNSGDTLKVRFGSENATLSEVWVNGSKRALNLVGGEFNTMSIGKNQVGANFYIGAWEKGSPAYTPTATTRYKSVLLERLAGSHEHTEACKTTVVHHVGGNNTHVHTLACLGPESSHKYLAGAIQDWNNYKIDDATLRKYLGESLWNQLGMPRKTTAFIKTTNNITLNRDEAIEVPIIKGSQNFAFTGNVQTFTAPGTGDYTFEVWGAQGATGTGGGAGGTGGYAKGTINLTAGQVVNIYVGGQNGFNGGGSGGNSANSGGNGGGASDIRVGGAALTNRVLVAGGGGGSSGGSNGGSPNNRYSLVGANGGSAHGGDGTEGNPSNASSTNPGAGRGATGSAGGAGGAGNSVNSTSSSDGAYYQSGGGGGGGGYYGGGGGASAAMNGGSANRSGTSGSAGTLGQGGSGGSGITSTPQAYWSGTGGGGGAGSGYIGGVTGGTMTNAGRTGNGYATVSYDIVGGGGAETLLNYTGNYQTYTAPTAGTYTFELWGAQGGNNGAYGQYVKESRVLSAGQTVYVYVGGQGTTSSGSGGGWNGGGHNYNGYGGGGGATDIRIGGTALTNRVIVAGGGAGLSHTGSAYTSHNRYSVLGVGQNATGHHGAGGGGGYYGGTGGTGCDGIAYSGSSFAAGAERTSNYSSGGTVVTYGSRAGNGQVKITAPPAELNKTYTFTTPSNPSELDIDVRRLTGTSNMKIDLHKGATPTTANRIGTVTGNPNAVYPTTVLEPNTTYTIVVSTATAVTTSFNIQATLTSRGLKYSDIVSLPNVDGKAAWEQIPYYLSDGTRNPMYRCNGEPNTHICELSGNHIDNKVQNGDFKAGLTNWDTWGTSSKSVVTVGGKQWLRVNQNDTLKWRGVVQQPIPLQRGTEYKLTFKAYKATASSGDLQLITHQRGDGNNDPQVNKVFSLTTTPAEYELTFTSTNLPNKTSFSMMLGGVEGSPFDIYITDIVLSPQVESLCFETTTLDKCTEPHHKDGHYENDWLCYSPDLDDNKYDPNFVQNSKVNTKAAEFVSLDWDYTLYADSIDNLRSSTGYQLNQTLSRTGMGYYDTNINGDFDDVRFVRGKYVKFPWTVLYDGVLYGPDEWVVLGDRGTYNKGYTDDKAGDKFGGKYFNGDGFGGSHYNSTGDLFHGQQVAYNVQNWSLYNQQIYHDLYKSFYDFYLPIINDEQSLATVTYAVVAVNAPDNRGLPNAAGHSVLFAVADLNSWLRSGIVSNKVRRLNTAEVGAGKIFKVDVVGRIGGLVMNDTTDVKFSDTFKKPLTPEEDTKVVYDIDMADLSGTKPNRTTRPLQASSSITTGGKLENGTDGYSDRAKLTAPNDWVGFDYAGGNARKFVITVRGSGLQAGEFVLNVEDGANGNYTLRLADMTVNKRTNEEITVTVDVKQTNASVDLSPRFNLIDTSVPNVYVESMSIAIGGSGFSQGLNQVVDPTRQNFYITDLTDVRGIYLGPAENTGRAEEGQGALAWRRYHNYTNLAEVLGDWIRMSDATQVRNSNNISGRSTPEYGTRAVDTYGSRPWVQMEDPLYRALAGSGGKAIVGPLTSDHNVINQYRRPEAQLSVGSKVFFDITTVGNYQGMTAELEIVPTYYLVDTTRVDANGAVALIPVDVYQFSSAGKYQPVNIFGAPYGGFTPSELDTFNQYRLSVNWLDEATGANNRRMVTNEEWQATASYANLFTDWIYDVDIYDKLGGIFDGPEDLPTPIGRTESPRKLPSGIMPIGGSQYIYQDYRTQTFIGSNNTYGVDKSAGLFTEFMSDPTESAKYVYWQASAQRWHSTLGLPSDAVFVPLQQDPETNKFTHVDAKDIVKYAVDITENLIIGYIDTYANGSVWRLHYGNQGLQRTFSIGEQAYKLPLAGPAGPAMANPYPGQTSVGSDYVNGGIPFVIFGGSKVEGQADIIKTN